LWSYDGRSEIAFACWTGSTSTTAAKLNIDIDIINSLIFFSIYIYIYISSCIKRQATQTAQHVETLTGAKGAHQRTVCEAGAVQGRKGRGVGGDGGCVSGDCAGGEGEGRWGEGVAGDFGECLMFTCCAALRRELRFHFGFIR
jgi:hypothetical protein